MRDIILKNNYKWEEGKKYEKTFIKSMLLVGFVFVSVFSVGIKAHAAIREVKSYDYDYNTVLGYNTNYHNYTYKYVPDNAHYHHSNKSLVGGSWNYERYQVIQYYISGGCFY